MGSSKDKAKPDFVPFMNSLNALFEKTRMKGKELAEKIDAQESSISQYRKGLAIPDPLKLAKIAKAFNTTTDYLLGLTDVSSISLDTRSMCAYTGLSNDAVEVLKYLQSEAKEHGVGQETTPLDEFLTSPEFRDIAQSLDYLSTYKISEELLRLPLGDYLKIVGLFDPAGVIEYQAVGALSSYFRRQRLLHPLARQTPWDDCTTTTDQEGV